jgi:transcriptional regulator with XRE-family HTH domain
MAENNPLSGTITRETIAGNVRKALRQAGVSERVMAHRIGLPQSNFSRRMNSEVPFTVEQVAAIATELHIPVATLLDNTVVAA